MELPTPSDRPASAGPNVLKQLALGVTVGLGLGGISLVALEMAKDGGEEPCQGLCGVGTMCVDGLCQAASTTVPQAKPTTAKDRRKRKSNKIEGDQALPDLEQGGAAAVELDNDTTVPPLVAKEEIIDGTAQSAWLSDETVREHMRKLDPAFEACVAKAMAHAGSQTMAGGQAEIELGIAADGHVTGVNAKVPELWTKHGLRACVRKAVFAHRFPSFSGSDMRVTTSFRFE